MTLWGMVFLPAPSVFLLFFKLFFFFNFILRWKGGNDITKELFTSNPCCQNHFRTIICNSGVYNDEIFVICYIQNPRRPENQQYPLSYYTNLTGVKSCKLLWSFFSKVNENVIWLYSNNVLTFLRLSGRHFCWNTGTKQVYKNTETKT